MSRTTRDTAEHEARHAAVGLILDMPLITASAIPDGDSRGRVRCRGRKPDPSYVRRQALQALAGPMGDDDYEPWPPEWPSAKAWSTDERHLAEHVAYLKLDAAGYKALVDQAYDLLDRGDVRRLVVGLALLLEQGRVPDGLHMKHVHAITEAKMETKTMQASVVAQDLGEFTAIAATWTVDRQREQIVRGAFRRTIKEWMSVGRNIPVHWEHLGSPENVIGHITPDSVLETSKGLQVSGRLDIHSSDVAREAWRSMKNNAVGLSFGFLVRKSRKRSDGVRELTDIDLFEISLTAAPVSRDTRILSMKSEAATLDRPMSDDELRQACIDFGVDVPTGTEVRYAKRQKARESRELQRETWRMVLENALGGPLPEPPDPATVAAEERRKAKERRQQEADLKEQCQQLGVKVP